MTVPAPVPDAIPAALRELEARADVIFQFFAIEQAHERGKMRRLEQLAGADRLRDIRKAARELTAHLTRLAEKAGPPASASGF